MTTDTNTATATATDTNTATFAERTAIDDGKSLGVYFPYDSQLPIAEFEGTRVLTICYKQTAAMKAKGIAAKGNVYTRLPIAHLTETAVVENAARLAPYVVAYLQGIENTFVSSYHKDGGINFHTDSLSLDRILNHLEESGSGGAMDTAAIREWFSEHLAESITTTLAGKLGTAVADLSEEQQAKIATILEGYLGAFVSLASGKTQMVEAQRARLRHALDITETANTLMGKRFLARFDRMDAKEKEALGSLGDLDL